MSVPGPAQSHVHVAPTAEKQVAVFGSVQLFSYQWTVTEMEARAIKCPACGHQWVEQAAGESGQEEYAAETRSTTSSIDPDDHRRYVAIARFKYAAEAGFFESELAAQLDVPTRIIEQNRFDTVAGLWVTWFMLCVPEEHAHEAQRVLTELVARENAREAETADWQEDGNVTDGPEAVNGTEKPPETAAWTGGPAWEPVDLTSTASKTRSAWPASWALAAVLLAGFAGFGVAKMVTASAHQGRRIPDSPTTERLLRELSRKPWIQPLGNHGVRLLWADPKTRMVLIREDVDGDGTVDRQLELLKL